MSEVKANRKSGMVRVLGGFSEKNKIQSYRDVLQIDEFDDASRVQISNELFRFLDGILEKNRELFFRGELFFHAEERFCKDLLNDVFCTRLTNRYYHWQTCFEDVTKVIMQATYNEVLDVIQYICNWLASNIVCGQEEIYEAFNSLFEQENIGYRFIEKYISPITDPQELSAINQALTTPIDGCRKQIQNAVALISDRNDPDYKNSIKESISAVESICQVVTGNDKATLGEALKQLEDNGIQIHPALKQGFLKLYGYTSDQGGIRHAEGMFESNVTFEEAKYMLSSCSAFINYLIAEYAKRGN